MCSWKSCPYSAGLACGLAKLRKIHFNWNALSCHSSLGASLCSAPPQLFLLRAGRTHVGLTEGTVRVGTNSSLLGIQEQAEPFSLCRSSVGVIWPSHLAEAAAAAWELAGASQQKGVRISASPGNEVLCFIAPKSGREFVYLS